VIVNVVIHFLGPTTSDAKALRENKVGSQLTVPSKQAQKFASINDVSPQIKVK
jgi:hypothetical protein